MRASIILLAFILISKLKAQDITGTYKGNYGRTIELNKDSTFRFSWHFDLAGSWSIGTWKMQNDNIELNSTPIFDTLELSNSKDSLVLSWDEHSGRITSSEFAISLISGGGQNRVEAPTALIFRSNKLYQINRRGKPSKKKGRTLDGKKYNSWYTKSKE